MDKDDCIKPGCVFTFLFAIAFCSACLFFCTSSESFAVRSCSYFCTIHYPTGDQLVNLISLFLFFSFVSIEVKLADRFSILPIFNIWCWHSCMAKEISVLKSTWSLLPFPFMSCLSVFYISSQKVSCFCLFEPSSFFFGIVEHHI